MNKVVHFASQINHQDFVQLWNVLSNCELASATITTFEHQLWQFERDNILAQLFLLFWASCAKRVNLALHYQLTRSGSPFEPILGTNCSPVVKSGTVKVSESVVSSIYWVHNLINIYQICNCQVLFSTFVVRGRYCSKPNYKILRPPLLSETDSPPGEHLWQVLF